MHNARVYGESLYMIAKEEDITSSVFNELQSLDRLFAEFPDYAKILDSPQVSRHELTKIIDEDFAQRINKYTLNFLKLLGENHIAHCLHECFCEYKRHYKKDNNIKTVYITTAKPISKQLEQKLVERMQEKIGGEITLKTEIDESLIGGIIIKTDDMSIDASIKNEIENMKESMAI